MVHSLGSVATFFLLNGHDAWRIPSGAAEGRLVLGAGLPHIPGFLFQALDIPWLGPGLIVGFVLLVTLRGRPRTSSKPLQRRFRMPKLERYRGMIQRRHQDLEV